MIHERVSSTITPYRGRFRVEVFLDGYLVKSGFRDTYGEALTLAKQWEAEVAAESAFR